MESNNNKSAQIQGGKDTVISTPMPSKEKTSIPHRLAQRALSLFF